MKISINDCSCEKLTNICIKCGFQIFEGKKHRKVKNNKGQFVTLIPRHTKIKKPLIEGILKSLINAGANIKIIK